MSSSKSVIYKFPAVHALLIQYDDYSHNHILSHLKNVFPELWETKYVIKVSSLTIPIHETPKELNFKGNKVQVFTATRSDFPEIAPDGKVIENDDGYTVYSPFINHIFFFLAQSQSIIQGFLEQIEKESLLRREGAYPIYRWSFQSGHYDRSSNACSFKAEDLQGLQQQYGQIKRLINNYQKNLAKITKMGITSGLNLMFYGPPGVGKTSFVKALVEDLNINLYITTLQLANPAIIPRMLNPNTTKLSLVLVEDFDRYLSEKNRDVSSILNALDGVEQGMNFIRVFSANDPNIIESCPAMASRMHVFQFEYPSKESLKKQIQNIFEGGSEELIDAFLQTIGNQPLSNRELNLYMVKYLDLEPDEAIRKMTEDWKLKK